LLVIRLSRKGRRNHPMYRLLVAEHSKPTDGNFVEIVGNYNPTAKDQSLTVNKERVQYWISKGAQPSNSVSKLLNRTGFDLPVEERHGKPKKEAPVEEPKLAETAPAVVEAEASAEEPKAEEAPAVEETPAPVVEEAPAVEETPAEPEAPAPAPETDSGKEA
jgi:small subunit ribosomal protein S16